MSWPQGLDMFRDEHIPAQTRTKLDEYVFDHLPVGSFLEAVLSNDLAGAFARADSENLNSLPAIVAYVYNHTPSSCWGSPERYREWLSGSRD